MLEGARTRVRTLCPKIRELASEAQGESVFAAGEIPVATTKHKQEKGRLAGALFPLEQATLGRPGLRAKGIIAILRTTVCA